MGIVWLRSLFKWELQKNENIDTTWLFFMLSLLAVVLERVSVLTGKRIEFRFKLTRNVYLDSMAIFVILASLNLNQLQNLKLIYFFTTWEWKGMTCRWLLWAYITS